MKWCFVLIFMLLTFTASAAGQWTISTGQGGGGGQPANCNDPGVHCLETCNQAEVGSAVTAAVDGDTVIMPEGTCHWTTAGQIVMNNGINLVGTDRDRTHIIDDRPTATPIINVQLLRDVPVRISNFTITGGLVPKPPAGSPVRFFNINTYSHHFRVDHLTLDNMQLTDGISFEGDAWALVDNVVFQGDRVRGTDVRHGAWSWDVPGNPGPGGVLGDGSWAAPDTMGTEKTVMVEDTKFLITGQSGIGGPACNPPGGRAAVRHSQITYFGTHGLDSAKRQRSCRQVEVYDNDVRDMGTVPQIPGLMGTWRGGTGIVYHNYSIQTSPTTLAMGNVRTYRESDGFQPWGPAAGPANNWLGACDGTGPFDDNGAVVYTGTVAAASNGNTFSVADSPNWTTNQWGPGKGYAVNGLGDPPYWGSSIASNTDATITVMPTIYGPTSRVANQGQTFHIQKVNSCLDGIGMGQGDLISGGGDTVPPSPVGWPHQALDPIYAWDNTRNGGVWAGVGVHNPGTSQTLFMRHLYRDENAPAIFDGTTTPGNKGIGRGLKSAIPPTCTPQVGYWATDEQILYQCSAVNTWTPHWHPYTYPHPWQAVATMSRNGHVIETGDGHVLVHKHRKKPKPKKK